MKDLRPVPNNIDIEIIAGLQHGIEIKEEPFSDVARNLGLSQEEVISRIETLEKKGVIRRFGAAIRPLGIGFWANGMVICKIPRNKIVSVGKYLSCVKEVTHCYERKTIPGIWDYNLFFVIHGPTRESVERFVAALMKKLRITKYEILFSIKELKKTNIMF